MTHDPEAPGRAGAANARTYRRSAWTRIVGTGCVLLFAGGAVSSAARGGFGYGFLILVCLGILSLCNLVTASADQVTLSDAGIECRNPILRRLGQPDRLVAWEEVVRVREHRRIGSVRADAPPNAIFLTLRSGRRLVLDSLEHYDEILDTIRHRCGPHQPTGGAP